MYDYGFSRPARIETAADWLVKEFWADLRTLARRERKRVRAGQTWQTTALMSEAWLRLRRRDAFLDDQHFLRASALAMRCVLIDHARARSTSKRRREDVELLGEDSEPYWESDERLLDLHDTLVRLASFEPRLAEVVELRFFGGYTEEQTADLLGLTDRTVRRDWLKAKTWLHRMMSDPSSGPGTARDGDDS